MDLSRTAARIRSALGWATADRREEAKGKLEELDNDASDQRPTDDARPDDGPVDDGPVDDRSVDDGPVDDEALLDEAELHVRHDHGDLAPSAQPDDRPPASPHEPG